VSHFQARPRESFFICVFVWIHHIAYTHLSNKTIDGEPAAPRARFVARKVNPTYFLTHKCTSIIWRRTHKKFHGRKTIWIKLSHQAFSHSFPVCVALIGDEPREKRPAHLVSAIWLVCSTGCDLTPFVLPSRATRHTLLDLFIRPSATLVQWHLTRDALVICMSNCNVH